MAKLDLPKVEINIDVASFATAMSTLCKSAVDASVRMEELQAALKAISSKVGEVAVPEKPDTPNYRLIRED